MRTETASERQREQLENASKAIGLVERGALLAGFGAVSYGFYWFFKQVFTSAASTPSPDLTRITGLPPGGLPPNATTTIGGPGQQGGSPGIGAQPATGGLPSGLGGRIIPPNLVLRHQVIGGPYGSQQEALVFASIAKIQATTTFGTVGYLPQNVSVEQAPNGWFVVNTAKSYGS